MRETKFIHEVTRCLLSILDGNGKMLATVSVTEEGYSKMALSLEEALPGSRTPKRNK